PSKGTFLYTVGYRAVPEPGPDDERPRPPVAAAARSGRGGARGWLGPPAAGGSRARGVSGEPLLGHVAGDPAAGSHRPERRRLSPTALDHPGAAGMEPAARREADGARGLALDRHRGGSGAPDLGHGEDERLGGGVPRR